MSGRQVPGACLLEDDQEPFLKASAHLGLGQCSAQRQPPEGALT